MLQSHRYRRRDQSGDWMRISRFDNGRNTYFPKSPKAMYRSLKVVFSPSFSCSAWLASRAASQITPNQKSHREILTHHCCPECFAQQVPQSGSWSKSAPARRSGNYPLVSCYADPAVWLELLLRQKAKRARSAAKLAGLPTSMGMRLPRPAVAKWLQGARRVLMQEVPTSRNQLPIEFGTTSQMRSALLDHCCKAGGPILSQSSRWRTGYMADCRSTKLVSLWTGASGHRDDAHFG